MQSFTPHPFNHSGAAASLLSAAAPSSSTTTRNLALIAIKGVSNQGFGLGFGSGVKLKSRIRCGRVRMQRLLMRRIQGETSSRPCIACRSSSSSRNGPGEEEYEESPPQNVVLKAISEVSKSEGRVGKTTNMVIGGTVKKNAEGEWDAIDQKVNVYPMIRDFTAIGTGGDEFVVAMVQAVESVIETPGLTVTQKLSSQGKYVSVRIGGVTVTSSEQVRAVYDAMRKDVRMKYFL